MRFVQPRLFVALALAVGAMATGVRATPAHADYGRAIYQDAISFNCDSPTLCQGSTGGFWGWAAFNADGTGSAQFAGCGHTVGGGGPGSAGAGHTDQDFTWVAGNGPFGPGTEAFLTSETDTFTGHGTPQTITIPKEYVDSGFPLVPGHYNAQVLFGTQAPPGMNFEIQVTYIPPK